MIDDVLAHFPPGATPRSEQVRLLRGLADAVAEAWEDPGAPRVLLVEAPPGVGKSHVAMTLARWSGDAYLLTSQKLLQDQYEYQFGAELQLVKGRDNYRCERYDDAHVPTSQGMCRRPRGPVCQCPYARAKAAALAGPILLHEHRLLRHAQAMARRAAPAPASADRRRGPQLRESARRRRDRELSGSGHARLVRGSAATPGRSQRLPSADGRPPGPAGDPPA